MEDSITYRGPFDDDNNQNCIQGAVTGEGQCHFGGDDAPSLMRAIGGHQHSWPQSDSFFLKQ